MSTLESPHTEIEAPINVVDEVRRVVSLFYRPGDVAEMRVPKAGRNKTISGYFDDFDQFVKEAQRLEGLLFPGVYSTLNPVYRALLGRANNRLKSHVDVTTADTDIECRRLVLVDCDPRRPAGISSSNPEHDAALNLARHVRGELLGAGWPEPIFADSGNGGHLIYRVDLPNDPVARDLIKHCLQALAARHNTDEVAIDESTFNASRISKLYGTTARKGDSTEDRPHRVSRILEAPPSLAVVSPELLHQLAAQAPEKPAGRIVSMPARARSFDLEEFLARHKIPHRPAVAYDGGRKYVLEFCGFDQSHRAPDSAVFQGADGRLGFHCFHNSCQGRTWREFRELFEPTDRNTRALPQFEDPDAPPWDDVTEWWLRHDMPSWSRHYLEDEIRKIEKEKKWQWVDSYPYTEQDGTPVLVKVRFLDRANDKTFRQFVLTPKRGWKLRRSGEARALLYHWPRLTSAREVFLVSSEILADYAADRLGIVTTCHIDGEWHDALNDTFRDKRVVIADSDKGDKGRQFAREVSRALYEVAKEIRLLRIPGLAPKQGFQDWIEAGGTAEQLK